MFDYQSLFLAKLVELYFSGVLNYTFQTLNILLLQYTFLINFPRIYPASPSSKYVHITQPLDVRRNYEKVQIEVCPYAYYIFITDSPNLPDIWCYHPSSMDRKYISQTHNQICQYGWDTRSKISSAIIGLSGAAAGQ